MTHGEDRYIRNHEYSTATRIPQIPAASAPSAYDSDEISVQEVTAATHVFREGDFVCPGFFDNVNIEYFNTSFQAVDWNYNMRRNAQAILPCLYLGPSSLLKDMDCLSANGFTLLLAVRSKQSAQARLVSGESQASRLSIEADSIDVRDSQELIASLPRAIRRINDHISSPGPGNTKTWPAKKIYVFCESGNERSAMVVMAYLMVMFNLDLTTATNMVQQRRFSISIDEKMRQLMASFEAILVAKQDVEKARRAAAVDAGMQVSKKRSRPDLVDSDGDCEMDADGSQDSPTGRKPLAPFKDR